jgi:hypothetical protein
MKLIDALVDTRTYGVGGCGDVDKCDVFFVGAF